MSQPIENISTNLFNFLKDRFDLGLGQSLDESGTPTDNPKDIKVFAFDYMTSNGENQGCVVLSLLNDTESTHSVKIYFGQEISSLVGDEQKEWFKFLQELRQFAKMHLLGFDARNLNKNIVSRRDIEPMFESTFGPIDGSIKTSHQPLDNMKIVIKHSDKIDPTSRNARSRKIEKIYLTNPNGERFLLPFKSLQAARAMARHVNGGGTPYDTIGKNIVQLVDEMSSLNRFIRRMKASASGIEENRALEASRSRYEEIKRIIASLISDGGYRKNSESLKTDFTEIEDDENPLFSGYEMDDDISNALPYVKRAYGKAPVMPEESEFSNWINEDLEQKYTSEKPSVNQLASVFNKVYWEPNTINLDFGGGAYQKATIFLNGKKVTNLVIDFNRTPEHNMEMRNLLDEHPADTATLANVLNVIYEEDVRQGVLKEIKKYLKTGGKLYICVYEGDKSGVGKETNKGWQENRKLSSYLPEVQNVFPNAIITKGMIICDNGALTEADMMCGFSASPFTTPYVAIPNHYHSTKEISNMTDTSGKMSPLTMLNKEEPDAEIEQLKKDQKYLQGKI